MKTVGGDMDVVSERRSSSPVYRAYVKVTVQKKLN